MLLAEAPAGAEAAAIVDLPGCRSAELPRNDDESSPATELGFALNVFGTPLRSVFVNNNGNVTFTAALRDFTPAPIASVAVPMIVPFWADVDTRPAASGIVTYGQAQFNGRPAFCVIWGPDAGVGRFNSHTETLNRFQLLIVDRADVTPGDADIIFNYDQVQWDTGDFSNGVSARWGFTNGAGVSFEGPGSAVPGALLDNGPQSLVRSSTASPLPGRHVFAFRAPQTTLLAGPPAVTNDATPTFRFSADQAGATFECRVDQGEFAPCASPFTLPAQADGAHGFAVRAVTPRGLADASPAGQSFTVDTIAPETALASGPPAQTAVTTPTFAFRSNEPGARFQCRMDGGPFGACGSPFTAGPLALGPHTFAVRAVDAAGNVDATPASQSFTVDTVAPETNLDSGPPASTNVTTPAFAFSSDDQDVEFQCRMDGGLFTECRSPLMAGPLALGPHTFAVRAVDAAGNVDATPATSEFAVDTVAPETVLVSGPPALTAVTTPAFAFESNELGVAFQCQVDGGPFGACGSPFTAGPLALGAHSFAVRAIDAAGNVDASPAGAQFTVRADTDADGVFDDTPDNCGDVANATQLDSDEDGVGDACEIFAPGDTPVVVGRTTTVELVAGEVFVKLPRSAKGRSARAAQQAPIPGFLPLKGVASVPVGSTVDSRKGQIAITTASAFRRPSARPRLQTGRFAAALFRIRQERTRRAARARRPATTLAMQTPPGLARACARSSGIRPIKGIVRSFSGSAPKGIWNTVGAASVTRVSRNASWIVQDRCNGTSTELGRGRARITNKVTGRVVRLRAGQGYIARARLFAARRNRLP